MIIALHLVGLRIQCKFTIHSNVEVENWWWFNCQLFNRIPFFFSLSPTRSTWLTRPDQTRSLDWSRDRILTVQQQKTVQKEELDRSVFAFASHHSWILNRESISNWNGNMEMPTVVIAFRFLLRSSLVSFVMII